MAIEQRAATGSVVLVLNKVRHGGDDRPQTPERTGVGVQV